jgi:isoleucyl-tRNA synthetase
LRFTAEEIWKHMPEREEESVFLSDWLVSPKIESGIDWDRLNEINTVVLKALEVARDEGVIGSSLDACLTVYADGELAELLASFGEELHFLFITSDATLASAVNIPEGAIEADGVDSRR